MPDLKRYRQIVIDFSKREIYFLDMVCLETSVTVSQCKHLDYFLLELEM